MEKYSKESIVTCYEADANELLRPTAMLDMMQEAANVDATRLGFGFDNMIATNTAWVLSRLHLKVNSYPKWRDAIKLYTWHKGAFKLFYLSDFSLKDAGGNSLIDATTSWLIIDLNTRRLSRNSELADENTCIKEDAISEPADKITIPQGAEFESAGTHKVVWSDIDTNNHVNNVKYVVWALDIVNYEDSSKLPLKELFVNFDNEVLAGQEVELYKIRQETEEGIIYYVQGKVDGKQSFIIKLIF